MIRLIIQGDACDRDRCCHQGLARFANMRLFHPPCYAVPIGFNLRSLGRDDELNGLRETLDPPAEASRLRAMESTV